MGFLAIEDSFWSRHCPRGSPFALPLWMKDCMSLPTGQRFLTLRVEVVDATVRPETCPGGLLDDRLSGHPDCDIS